MVVKLAFGFDTERPWGKDADTPNGKSEREANLELIGRLNALMDFQGAGRTFFILGDYIDKAETHVGADHLKQVFHIGSSLVEIGQHTYNHVIVAPIATRPDRQPVSLEALREELDKTASSLKRIFQVREVGGLRTPLGYVHRALAGSPELLAVFKETGLEYISSSLRSSDWGINAPLREKGLVRQPFVYANGLVEVPSHGWQDSAFTGTSKTQGTENYPRNVEEIIEHYKGLLGEARALDVKSGPDTYLGTCMHPWAIRAYDPSLRVIEGLLNFARKKNIECISYGKASEEIRETQS